MTEKAALILTQRIMEMVPPGEREEFVESEGVVLLAEAACQGWPFMVERLEPGIFAVRIDKPKKKPKKKPK